MANHDVSNAEFNSELRRYETTDRGAASVFNENEKVLINNDIALKKLIENSNSSSNSQLGDISKDVNDVNDKLDKVINDTGTNADIASEISETLWGRIKFIMSIWTKERANKLDSLDTINNNIGISNNVGGTVTTGSIFAKLNSILSMWTSARANRIDNLDTQISTRAAQSTLDSINAKIDSLSASISNNSGGGIKRVYRGYVDGKSYVGYLDVTLDYAINTSKSFLILNTNTPVGNPYRFVAGKILDSRTLRFYSNALGSDGIACFYNEIYWQVVEFN